VDRNSTTKTNGKYIMNKSELIDAVSNAAELSKSDAARAVDGVIATVTEALKSGDQVTVVGFGTFLVRQNSARAGRNPRTGETIQIAASNRPAFKAGKALKDAVN
jgi:DNA-binding protein HU-beta